MNFFIIYDGIFMLIGFYGISLCIKVNLSKNLTDIRLLMPRDVKPEECKDSAAFIGRILPWMILFSVSVILAGLTSLVEDIGLGLPHTATIAMFAVCCIMAVVFFIFQRKAVGEFWDKDEDE